MNFARNIPMRNTLALLIVSTVSLCAADASVSAIYDSQLRNAEGEIVALAKAMPESAYNFVPTSGSFDTVRSFGTQAKHIAAAVG